MSIDEAEKLTKDISMQIRKIGFEELIRRGKPLDFDKIKESFSEETLRSCTSVPRIGRRLLLTGVCHSEAPRGRKYCVPLTGSWSRRKSCCKSSLRSTKSISDVLITRRSEAE